MRLTLTDKNNQQTAEVLVQSCTNNLVQGIIISHTFDDELLHEITEFEDLENNFVVGNLLD